MSTRDDIERALAEAADTGELEDLTLDIAMHAPTWLRWQQERIEALEEALRLSREYMVNQSADDYHRAVTALAALEDRR